MKKSTILTAALIICLAALGVCAWLMFGGSAGIGLTYANEQNYTVGDARISDPVEHLNIDWTEGWVNVEYHDGSDIVVSETSPKALKEDDRLRWWLDGTTLRIRFAKSGVRLSAGSLKKTLTVVLPEGTVLESADIGATSADVAVRDLAARDVRLSSTSGNINASTLAQKLTAEATSGNMEIRQAGDADSVTLTSTSGNISCDLALAVNVSADSTSGSISLALATGAQNIRAHSTSGSVSVKSASVKSADLSSTSGSIAADLAAAESLKIGSTSGTVTAKLPAEPGLTCKVSTTGGSFTSDIALSKNENTYSCGDGSTAVSIDTTSGDIHLMPAD